jgi:hypothetical protein
MFVVVIPEINQKMLARVGGRTLRLTMNDAIDNRDATIGRATMYIQRVPLFPYSPGLKVPLLKVVDDEGIVVVVVASVEEVDVLVVVLVVVVLVVPVPKLKLNRLSFVTTPKFII